MTIQNKHQEHFEDLILTGDLSVLDFFNSEYEVSLKIDGSPAIVWGTNPATGNFFVGTKSVFNKVKLKINESHEDIDTNHSGNVAQILHCCLDSLPRTEYIYQGDFIGFGGLNVYTPNARLPICSLKLSHKVSSSHHTQSGALMVNLRMRLYLVLHHSSMILSTSSLCNLV
jgi:hypothetical protein